MDDYRDIYSYLTQGGQTQYGDVASSGGGDDPKGPGGPLPIGTGQWQNGQYVVPAKYQGIIDVQHSMGGGEDPKASSSVNIDYTKLPNAGMTQFGRVDRTVPVNDPSIAQGPGQKSTLVNPKLVYNDPNFGWITPQSNIKQTTLDKVNSVLPYFLMAGAGAGLGALAFPTWATALTRAISTGSGFLGNQAGGNLIPTGGAAATAGAQQNLSPSVLTGGASAGSGGITPQTANNLLLLTRGR